jgi:hypothetical protein
MLNDTYAQTDVIGFRFQEGATSLSPTPLRALRKRLA